MAKAEKPDTVLHGGSAIGTVRIASDVLARIAGIAALDVEGVHAVSAGYDRNAVSKVSRSALAKGVKVQLHDGRAAVDLSLTVDYGQNIPDACREVQEKVSATIGNMTGLTVTGVNVRVAGVSMPEA